MTVRELSEKLGKIDIADFAREIKKRRLSKQGGVVAYASEDWDFQSHYEPWVSYTVYIIDENGFELAEQRVSSADAADRLCNKLCALGGMKVHEFDMNPIS